MSEYGGGCSEEQIVEVLVGLPGQLAGEHTPSPRQRDRYRLNVKRSNRPTPQGTGLARRLRPKYRQCFLQIMLSGVNCGKRLPPFVFVADCFDILAG